MSWSLPVSINPKPLSVSRLMVPSSIFQSPQKVSSSVQKNAVVTLGLGSDLTRASRRRRPAAHDPSCDARTGLSYGPSRLRSRHKLGRNSRRFDAHIAVPVPDRGRNPARRRFVFTLSSGSNGIGQVWSGDLVWVASTNATMPSPAACPPMPSATTNNPRSSRTEKAVLVGRPSQAPIGGRDREDAHGLVSRSRGQAASARGIGRPPVRELSRTHGCPIQAPVRVVSQFEGGGAFV